MGADMSIWFCEMKVRCPKFWGDLKATDNDLIRDCDACGKQVHFISSQEELEEAAMKGTCVAFYQDDSMSKHEITQYERIWELNKPSPFSNRRMTLGLPSSAQPFNYEDYESDVPTITNIKTAFEVEVEFKKMLKRVGGGFQFVGWIEKNKQGGLSITRSELAESTGSDRATALYASDYTKKSHIVAHACQVNIDGSLVSSGEITYYEDEGHDIESLLGTSLGSIVFSYSEPIGNQTGLSFRANNYSLLFWMMKGLKKNIADF